MDNQLIIGVILIVVGIALALLAYAFILNRRDQEREPQAAPEDGPEAAEAEEAPLQAGTPPAWAIPPAAAAQTPVTPAPPPVVAPPPAPPTVTAAPPSPQVPEPARLAPSRRTLAVATLMRDEVTGKLLVLVGGREYSTADELRASRDFSRVEYAAADLVKWLGVTTVRERVAERVATDEVKKPASMIEQINDILQRKMAEASGTSRGVRLLEGAGGSLRVFIGLQSYTLEDVPDDDVKRMIREAVAEWEAMQ
jgi:type IV secretory pathway VirB10-like protein